MSERVRIRLSSAQMEFKQTGGRRRSSCALVYRSGRMTARAPCFPSVRTRTESACFIGRRCLFAHLHFAHTRQPNHERTNHDKFTCKTCLTYSDNTFFSRRTRFLMPSRIRSAEELSKIENRRIAQAERCRLNCCTQYAQTEKEDSLMNEKRTAKFTSRSEENAMTCSVERTRGIKLQARGQLALKQARPTSKKKTRRRFNASCCTQSISTTTAAKLKPYPSEPITCYPVRIMLTTSLILLLIATLATCYSFSLNTTNELRPHRQEEEDGRASAKLNLDATDHSQRPPGVNQAANDSHATGTISQASLSRPRRALKSQHAAGGTRQKPSSGSAVVGQAQASRAASEQTSASEPKQQQQQASRGVKDVTAQNGQSVLLHCLVEPNENGELPEVSWFRGTGEPQLLTYETTTIIKDERFLVRQGISRPNDWALQIKALDRTTDTGIYQCQTSGDSPQLQSYQLNIVEPQVSILDSPDLAVRLGGPINLTCVISQSADQLQYVFWYRDSRMINYDLTNEGRGKIVASKVANKQDTISSNLQIFQSRATDSGNYTCAPSGARSTSIYVHVLEATDKRLIMFQNDETNAQAASSQQTNSAISVHVVRLSRGRAYALFATLLIFSSWFQLVAQIQTAISLVLLAIIGVFLSHSTARPRRGRTHKRLDKGDERDPSGSDGPDHDEGRDPLLLERAREALNLLKTLSDLERSSQCSSVELNDEHAGGFRSLSNGQLNERYKRTLRPLVGVSEREQDGKLQTTSLSRPTGKHGDCHRLGRVPVVREGQQTGGINQEPRPISSSPRASPGGSAAYSPGSSTSAGSTGYNSDSRHSCLASSTGFCGHATPSARRTATPTVSLINERDEDDKLEHEQHRQDQLEGRELEMVELLRGRPSALKLIIEQLEQTAGGNRLQQGHSGDEQGPPVGETSEVSLLRERGEDQDEAKNKSKDNMSNNNNNSLGANQNNKLEDDSGEQIYSVPSSGAEPTSDRTGQSQHHAVERGTTSATFERPD